MISSIYEYDQIHDNAIAKLTVALNHVLEQKEFIQDEEAVDLADTNFPRLVYTLEKTLADIENNKVRYIYNKMDRDEFSNVLKNISENKDPRVITVGRSYKLRSYDTLRTLSLKYDVDTEYILSYNHISSREFDEMCSRNDIIKIPQVVNLRNRNNYADLMVFGSIEGEKSWGTDCSNEIEINGEDLKILTELETLQQRINNRFGSYGDIPGYESELIDTMWGEDIDPELLSLLLAVKLPQQLLMEKSIAEVVDVQVETVPQGLIITNVLRPLNIDETLTTIYQNKENSNNEAI